MSKSKAGFALIGAGGYIAPRHMQAIHETGNKIVVALDPSDSVGIMDSYGYDIEYFKDDNKFIQWIRDNAGRVKYTSVCSPNYLHMNHAIIGLHAGTDVICEKPLVIHDSEIDMLKEAEESTGHKVWVVLQLRYHPLIVSLKRRLKKRDHHNVKLRYITPRGLWYKNSWKGNEDQSGGLCTNIGIHFFDMLIWLFGPVKDWCATIRTSGTVAGKLSLENAEVEWFLSVERQDLPDGIAEPVRSLQIDDQYMEFSKGFTGLHTKVYESVMKHKGYGIGDAEPSLRLVSEIRNSGNETTTS